MNHPMGNVGGKEIDIIKRILVGPRNRVYVCPWIPSQYGKEADFVLRISDGLANVKLYYKPMHEKRFYKNIEIAFSKCSIVHEILKLSFSRARIRVRSGCFNRKGISYNISKERKGGCYIFNVDLSEEFGIDQIAFLAHDLGNKICEAQF